MGKFKKMMEHSFLLNEMKIKVLSGHLTAKDKKIVKQMLDRKMDSGRVGKADYFIKDLGKGQYEITQRMMDAGIGIGARKVLRNYKSKIQIKEGFILERMDYVDTAKQLVKQYGLKSKVKMGSGKNFGEYVPETDTITIRPSYKSTKDFLMTVLHEIGHALDAYRLGIRKYIKKYTQAGTMAAYDGLDPHDDNKWEEKAEKFAKREISRWI
jgi:Zn-dependent M32 family carboxypeptidase|tara:strand:- start:65 stop:697 length:633 start_codon:yes stop_codon:yes gene_type:complete